MLAAAASPGEVAVWWRRLRKQIGKPAAAADPVEVRSLRDLSRLLIEGLDWTDRVDLFARERDLPQVAAFADRHLVVVKDTGGAVTTSGVRMVEDTERARELARMLAGLPDSDLGIAHAEELLAVASREKRG